MTVSETYAKLVLEAGLSPDYVLDRMQYYELLTLILYLYLKSKDNWEQARLIAYIIAQANSKNKIKVTDIMSFPWEKIGNKENQKVTDEQIERLARLAKEFEKLLNTR